jgi:hypothetical protein
LDFIEAGLEVDPGDGGVGKIEPAWHDESLSARLFRERMVSLKTRWGGTAVW